MKKFIMLACFCGMISHSFAESQFDLSREEILNIQQLAKQCNCDDAMKKINDFKNEKDNALLLQKLDDAIDAVLGVLERIRAKAEINTDHKMQRNLDNIGEDCIYELNEAFHLRKSNIHLSNEVTAKLKSIGIFE